MSRCRFCSFFTCQHILIMVITISSTLLSLPLTFYVLTIVPQENKRWDMHGDTSAQFHLVVGMKCRQSSSGCIGILQKATFHWRLRYRRDRYTWRCGCKKRNLSFFHTFTQRDTYTEICCCCHLQILITDSLIFSTCRIFHVNVLGQLVKNWYMKMYF